MTNMAYCRFQNTLKDLRGCNEHMDDDDLSPEEEAARKRLIVVCRVIAVDYGGLEDKDT